MLIWVNEIICNQMVLKLFADGFFYQFAYCIEQDNGLKRFGRVIGNFVRFRDNNGQQCFEM